MSVVWLVGDVHAAPGSDADAQWWAALTGAEVVPSATGAVLSPPQGSACLEWTVAGGESALGGFDGLNHRGFDGLNHRGDRPSGGVTLRVVVDDVAAAETAALAAGAVRRGERGERLSLTSPGGLEWSLAAADGAEPLRPTPVVWPGGHYSMVYQVCVDVPPALWERERDFWARVLEAKWEVLTARPEFGWLRGERQLGLDVLVQRLDDEAPAPRVHLDFGTNDRAAEVARHREAGAVKVLDEQFWALMEDPWGRRYCITDRDPTNGRLSSLKSS